MLLSATEQSSTQFKAISNPAKPGANVAKRQAMVTEDWARLALADDVSGLAERLRLMLAGGGDPCSVLETILGPVAERLGQWGDEGRISFDAVDRGVKTLEDVISKIEPSAVPQATRGWRVGSILLAPFPGDQHSFGLRLVEELFRRDGWSVTLLPSPDENELLDEVSRNYFHILGLSLGDVVMTEAAAPLLLKVRTTALNPAMRIVLGGPALATASQKRLQETGADYLALEGTPSMQAMRDLLSG